MNIYVDAKEIKRGLFLIGYCDEMFDGGCKLIRVKTSSFVKK